MTIIAAYADPCVVLALMMIPALAQGTRPLRVCGPPLPPPPPEKSGIWPVSDVTRTVMVPLPSSGWCAK